MEVKANQLVVFRLADIEFGIDISRVQEIVRPGALTKVPLTPSYILGLTNLRGRILPVVDTRLRLQLEPHPVDDHSRLLVISTANGAIGFLVDEVKEVRAFKEDELEEPPNLTRSLEGFVDKVAKFEKGEQVVFLLECDRLVENISLTQAENISSWGNSAEVNTHENKAVEEERLLSFLLGQEEYAFRIKIIRKIIRYVPLKKIPEAPDYVCGLLTLRQKVVPVFDLRSLLGLESLLEESLRKEEHLQSFFQNWIEELKEAYAQKRRLYLGNPEDNLLGAWINERLENSRNEDEFVLLYKLHHLHKELHQTAQELFESQSEERYSRLEYLASEIETQLKKFNDLLGSSLKEEQRILILEIKTWIFGLLVDRVEEVLALPKRDIDPPPQEAVNDLSGIANLEKEGRLIFILDEEKIVPLETLEEYGQGGEEMSANVSEENQELQLVTFNLGDEEYGIPIVQIQEINRLGRITRVPHTPEFVEGVTNLRGEVIPVVDLRKRFGISPRERDDRTRLVIIQLNNKKTGLIVDWVNEVARLYRKDIEPPPSMLESQVDLRFISGIAKMGNERMIIVLNVDEIFSQEEKEAIQGLTHKEDNPTPQDLGARETSNLEEPLLQIAE